MVTVLWKTKYSYTAWFIMHCKWLSKAMVRHCFCFFRGELSGREKELWAM